MSSPLAGRTRRRPSRWTRLRPAPAPFLLRYQTFDVGADLHAGANAIGAWLGDGWYRGTLGFRGGVRNLYGDRLGLLLQLEVIYGDGTVELVGTDQNWRSTRGPIRSPDLYDGEVYDARLEENGWSSPGFDDAGWDEVRSLDFERTALVAPLSPPMRRVQVLSPRSITPSPSGRTIVDFGQNLVGRLRIAAQGAPGDEITLRHSEVLEHGELCTRPLRQAKATDRYVLRGGGPETWEPRFTLHGFRYAEVTGWPGDLAQRDLEAVVCQSDLERTGWFSCSDPLVEQLHENVIWSLRGNTLDVPTDCPQRDERLGWTGDIQIFAPTATFLYDVRGFLTSWLADLAAEQRDLGGIVPFVVPNIMGSAVPPAAAWGDAAVVVPWVLFCRTGDRGILEAQLGSMQAWVDRVAELAGERRLWDRGFQFGDWLDPAAPPDRPDAARADSRLVATAYLARSAVLLSQCAGELGQHEIAARYRALAAEVRDAFASEYVTPAGRLLSDAPTAYALAICFDLLPDAGQRRHAGERLASLVAEDGYRIATGFVGTPLLCDALCHTGHDEVAFRLLLQRECPSWLYPVTMGATTIWERWDSLLPDGSVNPGQMTSFNHYALGAVADWLHRTVAGLALDAPGYRRLRIAPRPGAGLTQASARHRTPYGDAEAGWRLEGEHLVVEALVPPNTDAVVVLPGAGREPIEVGSGRHRWTVPLPPRSEPRPLSLDSTLREIRDDPESWAVLHAALQEEAPNLASLVEPQLRRDGDTTLRDALAVIPLPGTLARSVDQRLNRLPGQHPAEPVVAPRPPAVVTLGAGPAGRAGTEVGVEGQVVLHNVAQARLRFYEPDPASAVGTGVVIAPGGGFLFLVMDREGVDVARWCTERGLTAFLLEYRLLRTPEDPAELRKLLAAPRTTGPGERPRASVEHEPLAVEDGRQAIATIRNRASSFGIRPDRIVALGFSAGGRVVLGAATAPDPQSRPSAVACLYTPTQPEPAVPRDAPPLFLAAAADDPLLPDGGARLYEQWRAAGRAGELHVFQGVGTDSGSDAGTGISRATAGSARFSVGWVTWGCWSRRERCAGPRVAG